MVRINLVLVCSFLSLTTFAALGDHLDDLVLFSDNHLALSFECTKADFVKKLQRECGEPHLAKPLDACLPLSNNKEADSTIALIVGGGGCSFEDKVRRAQAAGFKAAVIYGDHDPFPMAGNSSTGINIQAVSVSRVTGEVLASYAGISHTKLCIKAFEDDGEMDFVQYNLAISLFFLFLATGFYVFLFAFRMNERWAAAVASGVGVMSPHLVEAMPSLLFTDAVKDNNGTSTTCYICLQDYSSGDKLRSLPCDHKFHADCVDIWLKCWRTFCPVCMRDASNSSSSGSDDPPPSERTPLLSS